MTVLCTELLLMYTYSLNADEELENAAVTSQAQAGHNCSRNPVCYLALGLAAAYPRRHKVSFRIASFFGRRAASHRRRAFKVSIMNLTQHIITHLLEMTSVK